MSEQLALVEVDPLSERVRFALTHIRAAGEAGLHPEELGSLLHDRDDQHPADERCEWCGRDGARLLRELHRKRLITRRHGNAAVAIGTNPNATSSPSQADRIPF